VGGWVGGVGGGGVGGNRVQVSVERQGKALWHTLQLVTFKHAGRLSLEHRDL
jgi:hypothetical protein